MIDIISSDENGLGILDTQTTRAANILSVQLGALEYVPTLGIDLVYFLSDDFKFQNESFKSYLVQVLANRGINVSSLTESVESLFSTYTFNIAPEDNGTGMIAR